MPFYHKVGEIPRVKHTTFYKKDGKSLYREELFSSKGFSGVYSNKYYHNLPTAVLRVSPLGVEKNIDWPDAPVLYYHFFTDNKKTGGNFITARNVFLRNPHCVISTANVTEDTNDFLPQRLRRGIHFHSPRQRGIPFGVRADSASKRGTRSSFRAPSPTRSSSTITRRETRS